jgi:hypothetical protein
LWQSLGATAHTRKTFTIWCARVAPSVEDRGCITKGGIDTAVNAVWRSLTTEILVRVADRVRRNFACIIEVDGGNYYAEGAKCPRIAP